MNTTEPQIPSPPQGSRILSERRGETFVISGESQGIPVELYSSEEQGAIEKVYRLKEKLSRSSGGDFTEILTKQVFDWAIKVSKTRVTFSSKALPDDALFAVSDVQSIYRTTNGCLAVELSNLEEGTYQTQVLTGKLEEAEAEWLNGSLIQLFDLDQEGVAKARVQGEFKAPPTESFRLVTQAGGSRVEIQYVTQVLQRLFPLLIGGGVLVMAGFALLGSGGGGEGLLPNLVRKVSDKPLASQVVRYLIIAGLAYFGFRVAATVLGTLKMGVTKDFFEIKKGILRVGVTRAMPRSEMTALEQSTWIETHRDNENTTTRTRRQYWRLELKGDQSIRILSKEASPEDTDWLGQFLADWYGVPFVKKTVKK